MLGAIQPMPGGPLEHHPPVSRSMAAVIFTLPVLFFAAVAAWGPRHSPFYHAKAAQWIDQRLGPHSLESFLVRLKSLLMFGVVAIIHGITGLWHSRSIEPADNLASGFLLSGGIGFVVAHLVLYRRRAVGVFPTWTIEASGTYWWTLIGVAVFPAGAFVGSEHLGLPFELFVLPFFAVCFLAGWPYISGRAPYSFWLVAMCVWLGGGGLAVVLLQLIAGDSSR